MFLFSKKNTKKKNLIKNKKGDFAILGLILIPVFLLAFTQVVSVSYKSSTIKSNLQMNVDNISVLASQEWGRSATSYDYESGNEINITVFQPNLFSEDQNAGSLFSYHYKGKSTTDITSFSYYFDKFISKIDGYNPLWNYYMYREKDVNTNDEQLTIEIYYCFPSNNDMGVYDYYGIDSNGTKTGWYKSHSKSWEILKEKANQEFSFSGSQDSATKDRLKQYKEQCVKQNSLNMISGVVVAKTKSI